MALVSLAGLQAEVVEPSFDRTQLAASRTSFLPFAPGAVYCTVTEGGTLLPITFFAGTHAMHGDACCWQTDQTPATHTDRQCNCAKGAVSWTTEPAFALVGQSHTAYAPAIWEPAAANLALSRIQQRDCVGCMSLALWSHRAERPRPMSLPSTKMLLLPASSTSVLFSFHSSLSLSLSLLHEKKGGKSPRLQPTDNSKGAMRYHIP